MFPLGHRLEHSLERHGHPELDHGATGGEKSVSKSEYARGYSADGVARFDVCRRGKNEGEKRS